VRTANLERVRKRINIKDMPDMWIQPFGEVEEPERCKTTRNLQSD
jgi:hypothetical protein